ncbi:MAG: ribonuclease HIII [Chlorobi bacterium]|nr:ribonuclease HIII [Chlorobiota bacterium]
MNALKSKALELEKEYQRKLLKAGEYNLSEIDEKNYNYEFTIIRGGDKIKVLVYFGKKGLRTVFQGNENSGLFQEVKNILSDELSLDFGKREIDEPESYAGTDESGKGDFFGPLVVAAVFIDNSDKPELKRIGVQDSKNLSDFQIGKIARQIKAALPAKYSIISIHPKRYNELYANYRNLNRLLNWAHSKAILELSKKIDFDTVITDKFTRKEMRFHDELLDKKINFIQQTKAEAYTAVAAASILARDNFNGWFEKNKFFGKELPKGASDAVLQAAKKLSAELGKEKLNEYVKIHFKTFKKL